MRDSALYVFLLMVNQNTWKNWFSSACQTLSLSVPEVVQPPDRFVPVQPRTETRWLYAAYAACASVSPPQQKQSSALLHKIYGVIEKATGYSFPNLKDQPGSPGRRGWGWGGGRWPLWRGQAVKTSTVKVEAVTFESVHVWKEVRGEHVLERIRGSLLATNNPDTYYNPSHWPSPRAGLLFHSLVCFMFPERTTFLRYRYCPNGI